MICKYCGGNDFIKDLFSKDIYSISSKDIYFSCSQCFCYWYNGKLSGLNIDDKTYFLYNKFFKRININKNNIVSNIMKYEFTTEEDLRDTLIKLKNNLEFL